VAEGSSDGVTRRQAMGRGTAIAVGAAAGAAVASAPAGAAGRRHGGPGDSLSVLSVSLEQAERVIEAARRRAEQLGVAMYIVVVDSAGVEKASRRMDGNGQASPTLAPLKAQTANGFRTASRSRARLADRQEKTSQES